MPSDTKETRPPRTSERTGIRVKSDSKIGDAAIKSIQGPPEGTIEPNYYRLRQQIDGGVPKDYEGHHLIGIREAKSSAVLQVAAEAGYDINNGNNGIALPTKLCDAEKTGLPLHDGPPISQYTDFVTGQLEELEDDFIAAKQAGKPWSSEELLERVHGVEDTIRSALLERKVFLHEKDPNRRA